MALTQRDLERWQGEAQAFVDRAMTRLEKDFLGSRVPPIPAQEVGGPEFGDFSDEELDGALEALLGDDS